MHSRKGRQSDNYCIFASLFLAAAKPTSQGTLSVVLLVVVGVTTFHTTNVHSKGVWKGKTFASKCCITSQKLYTKTHAAAQWKDPFLVFRGESAWGDFLPPFLFLWQIILSKKKRPCLPEFWHMGKLIAPPTSNTTRAFSPIWLRRC